MVWKKEESWPRTLKLLIVSDTHMMTDSQEKLHLHYSQYLLKGGEKPSEEYKQQKDLDFKSSETS